MYRDLPPFFLCPQGTPARLLPLNNPATQPGSRNDQKTKVKRKGPWVTFRKLPLTHTSVGGDLIIVEGLVATKALPDPARSLPGPPHPGLPEDSQMMTTATLLVNASKRPAPTTTVAKCQHCRVPRRPHCKDSEEQQDTGRDSADGVLGP